MTCLTSSDTRVRVVSRTRLGAPLISRRTALGWFTASAFAMPAKASVSALMCPPQVGSFGGGAGGVPGSTGDLLEGNIDYSGAIPEDGPGERRLQMTNRHTGETYNEVFVQDGEYVQSALDSFSHFARDWRRNEAIPFSPKTIDIIWKIWKMMDTSSIFHLNSGYRTPTTNSSLPGAKSGSYHLKAMAADISISGRTVSQVHSAAVALKAGGVGKYTSDNFVHVDSGPVRYWGS